MARDNRYWAVVPAAGVGTRMQADIPKQYLQIGNKHIIEYALDVFCSHDRITGIMVAVSEQDSIWPTLDIAGHDKVRSTTGGVARCHSVINCLVALNETASADDWVLVHDAARPCINTHDINSMIERLADHPVGGLLALPVRDTMKRSDTDGGVEQTISRDGLWHALTPQMFRFSMLYTALKAALDQGLTVTDESQAVELTGARPLLIQGNPRNVKITHKDDLELAKLYLREM